MSEELSPREKAERRRRLARVFGEELPEQTRDDREPDEDAATAQQRADDWLRRQKPPHHG